MSNGKAQEKAPKDSKRKCTVYIGTGCTTDEFHQSVLVWFSAGDQWIPPGGPMLFPPKEEKEDGGGKDKKDKDKKDKDKKDKDKKEKKDKDEKEKEDKKDDEKDPNKNGTPAVSGGEIARAAHKAFSRHQESAKEPKAQNDSAAPKEHGKTTLKTAGGHSKYLGYTYSFDVTCVNEINWGCCVPGAYSSENPEASNQVRIAVVVEAGEGAFYVKPIIPSVLRRTSSPPGSGGSTPTPPSTGGGTPTPVPPKGGQAEQKEGEVKVYSSKGSESKVGAVAAVRPIDEVLRTHLVRIPPGVGALCMFGTISPSANRELAPILGERIPVEDSEVWAMSLAIPRVLTPISECGAADYQRAFLIGLRGTPEVEARSSVGDGGLVAFGPVHVVLHGRDTPLETEYLSGAMVPVGVEVQSVRPVTVFNQPVLSSEAPGGHSESRAERGASTRGPSGESELVGSVPSASLRQIGSERLLSVVVPADGGSHEIGGDAPGEHIATEEGVGGDLKISGRPADGRIRRANR